MASYAREADGESLHECADVKTRAIDSSPQFAIFLEKL